jgi:hypothetical protein
MAEAANRGRLVARAGAIRFPSRIPFENIQRYATFSEKLDRSGAMRQIEEQIESRMGLVLHDWEPYERRKRSGKCAGGSRQRRADVSISV